MKVKKRMASQPQGAYVITTITEKEYREKVKSYDGKTPPARFKVEVKQHNLDNCGKTFRVQRKKFNDKDILINSVISMSQKFLIPNIIIDDVYCENEARVKFPEYWL